MVMKTPADTMYLSSTANDHFGGVKYHVTRSAEMNVAPIPLTRPNQEAMNTAG